VITTGSADVVFKGLDVGNYVLEETEAPSGYSKLAEKIYVTVADDDVNGMPTLTVENGTLENDGITVTVNNYKGISLPETGSVASIIVMVVGLMIVLGGAAYLVMSRKKAQSK
jgi:LPXTG-motif cell wall-anchored protein